MSEDYCSTGNTVGQIFEGIGISALGMFGLGGLFDPIEGPQSKYQEKVKEMKAIQKQWNDIINTDQVKLKKTLAEFSKEQQELTDLTVQFQEQILQEAISKNSLFIAILTVAMLIILFFLLI